MTNERLLDMVRMRLDGCTLDEIWQKYGVSRQAVQQSLCGIANGRTGKRWRKPKKCIYEDIVYPNIRYRMMDLGWGYTRLGVETGKSSVTIRNALTGYIKNPSISLATSIAHALNMEVGMAFWTERSEQDGA